MKDKQAYINKLQEQLDDWQDCFDEYKARLEPYQHLQPGGLKYHDLLPQLEAKQKITKVRLVELRQADDQNWEGAKTDAEAALKELKELAIERF